jgi:transcription termination/antitermination protein NusG
MMAEDVNVHSPSAPADLAPAPADERPAEAAPADAPEPEAPAPEQQPAPEPELEAAAEAEPERKKHWYVVKVTSGREDTIKEALERRVRKEGLEEYFGQIVIPVEKITEVKVNKAGKRVTRTKERKLYPGYLMVQVEYNDRVLYLFRETSGVGDFVGAHPGNLERAPTPMSEREVARMLGPQGDQKDVPTVPRPNMEVGDHVRVVDGTFNGMEGTVKQILEAASQVRVELTIFGRPVNVDLEYYQVERA